MLDQKVIDITKRLFRGYYSKAEGIAPPNIGRREFGFGDFEKKIAFRHMAFKSVDDLKKYMVSEAPPFASYSTAEYHNPDGRPMEAKGWMGGELIFDLDASDLQLDCQKTHDRSWVCENCLDSVKLETIRLVEDFLMPDFGFSEKEMSINFSGNRGYHVHVSSESAFGLGSAERRQISEYITATGINAGTFFSGLDQKATVLHGPKPSDMGWGGRFAKGMIAALNSGEGALTKLGIDKATARKLARNSTEIVLGITIGNWDKVRIPKKAEFWRNVIKNMAIRQSDSIDSNVTNDIHHLIRLPNTLHGDTGLFGKRLGSIAELEKFDPMKDAIAFRTGVMGVRTAKVPPFTMAGEAVGPYDGTTVELPTYAALYLMLKRLAVPE